MRKKEKELLKRIEELETTAPYFVTRERFIVNEYGLGESYYIFQRYKTTLETKLNTYHTLSDADANSSEKDLQILNRVEKEYDTFNSYNYLSDLLVGHEYICYTINHLGKEEKKYYYVGKHEQQNDYIGKHGGFKISDWKPYPPNKPKKRGRPKGSKNKK